MPPPAGTAVRLHAVVAGEEAAALSPRRGVSVLVEGRIAALYGGLPAAPLGTRAALRHGRVIERAFVECSSVIPFRLGVELGSLAELGSLLRHHAAALAGQLARFAGRAEMGLKVKLAGLEDAALPPGIEALRQLAPEPADRHERIRRQGRDRIFDGCYLLPRREIEGFWQAVEAISRRSPELPVLGSGPWAAYSFCAGLLSPDANPPLPYPAGGN